MHAPYTDNPNDAVLVAHASIALATSAFVVARPLRPRIAAALFVLGFWLAAICPVDEWLLPEIGVKIAADHAAWMLRCSAAIVTLSFVLARSWWVAIAAAAAEVALYWLTGKVTAANADLAIVHLAWFGGLYGLHDRVVRAARRLDAPPPLRPWSSHAWRDLVLFAGCTALTMIAATVVVERFANSGDEWAYTYQADLFAHGKAYGTPPPCPTAFENYWVFYYLGKSFAQYTPGWSLAMAPFRLVRLEWAASAFALGAAAVGAAHLARRVARATDGASDGMVRASGTFAGLALVLGASALLNGASRYPHAFVTACFVWSIESVCRLAQDRPTPAAQWGWGALLGASSAMMLSTRPSDGGMLGVGLFLYFVVALARRRIGVRGFGATALSFAALGGLSLVILRLQLGEWWKTGYSLGPQFHPWIVFRMSAPEWNQFAAAVPIGMQAYCLFPASAALGLLGLAAARRATGIAFMLLVGTVALYGFYAFVEFGRTETAGYGPRYQLPAVVFMAVGTGVCFGALYDAAKRRVHAGSSLSSGGPAAVALTIALIGTVRLAMLTYPVAWKEVHIHNAAHRAIAAAKLKQAIVFVRGADIAFDPLDQTQNFETDKNPDVLILNDRGGGEISCVQKHFPDRKLYRARGTTFDVAVTPL